MKHIRGLLKAGQALSIVFAICALVGGIALIIVGAMQNGVDAQKTYLEPGVRLLVWCPFNVFGAIGSGIAKKKFVNKQVSVGISVLAIIAGVVSNIFGIPAGILMIINRDKINAGEAAPAVEEKPAEEKAE